MFRGLLFAYLMIRPVNCIIHTLLSIVVCCLFVLLALQPFVVVFFAVP
jgi:hypothetical protein